MSDLRHRRNHTSLNILSALAALSRLVDEKVETTIAGRRQSIDFANILSSAISDEILYPINPLILVSQSLEPRIDSCRPIGAQPYVFFPVDDKMSKSACNFRRTVGMRTPSTMKWKCRMSTSSSGTLPFKEIPEM